MGDFSFSVCMIARNESANIGKCITELNRLVETFPGSEIVVIDTGSEDDTVEIASRLGAKVFFFKWTGDFSAARNYAAKMAQNDLVLSVDCDEFLVGGSRELAMEFKKAVLDNPKSIGMSIIVSESITGNETERVRTALSRFYDRRIFGFSGSVHENIKPLGGEDAARYTLPLKFDHVGYYDPETRRKKALRNKELLLQELSLNKDDPYLLYQIGKCDMSLDDDKEAEEYYERALALVDDFRLFYVKEMVVSYGYILLNQKKNQEALALEQYAKKGLDNADYLFLMGLIYMKNFRLEESISSFAKATQTDDFVVEGVNSYKPLYNIGVIYEVTGNKKEAIEYYRLCGEYAPALNRIKELDTH